MGQTTKLNWYRNSSINSTTHFNTLDISEVQLSLFMGFPFSRCFACKKKMEPSMVSYMRTVQNNRREDFNPKMVGLVGNVEYPPANKPQGEAKKGCPPEKLVQYEVYQSCDKYIGIC